MTSLVSRPSPVKSARPKPPRSVRVLARFRSGGLLVRLAVGKDSGTYRVAPMASDIGPAFEVAELLQADDLGIEYATPYHVLLSGRASTCECTGFLKHGYRVGRDGEPDRSCKHLDGLRALKERGLI